MSASKDQLGLDFDVGGGLELTPEIALRASAVFSGSDLGRGGGNDWGTWSQQLGAMSGDLAANIR